MQFNTLRFDFPLWHRSALRAALLICLTTSPLQPAVAQNGLTPADVARLRSVTSAAISPGGAQVAYTLSVPRNPWKEKNGPAWVELHVVDTEKNSRSYVTGEVNISGVQWMPDGSSISFLAKRGDDKFRSLYIIPLSGGEARRILTHETDITGYTWSPEGNRVAFLAIEPDPKAKERKKLQEKGFNQKIFEEENRFVRVWVANLDGDESKPRMLDLKGNASELHWSPVDNRLTVALAPTPFIDDHYLFRKVHVVDSDSGEVLTQINHTAKLGQVAWNPDGKLLAMITGEDLNDPLQGRLMVIPSTGGTLKNAVPMFEGHISTFAWASPKELVFFASRGVWSTFGEATPDENNVELHLLKGEPIFSSMSLSNDAKTIAGLMQTPGHPSEVFLLVEGSLPRRLTNSNPWLENVRLAQQEPVRYQARDGLDIEGILIKPLDYQEGKQYPLVVIVHGGPEGHYSNGWLTTYSALGQMAAARGFAVFYPNYRASTGRGIAFSKMDHRDPAGKEFSDIIDGIDHLIEIGLVDKIKVGVTGGSYGGYATGWLSTFYSDHIAAGVMFVGISNQLSKWGVTDIPWEVIHSHFEMKPFEEWMFFLKRSPVYYADRSNTPLLILHGTEDKRVPTFQSFEMYRHLKTRGKAPVRLVLYPGEAHGNRKAAARFDYNLRALRWLEHYLKGPGGDPPPHELDYKKETN